MTLQIGDVAPDFEAETTEGRIRFHDWIGDSWAVLFSHPKNFTPVCTTELGYMAKLKPEFDRRNMKIIGLSVDPVDRHSTWANDIKETQGFAPNYPMIGDPDLSISKAWGMLPASANGDASKRTAADNQTVRNVFVIGPDKKIKLILVYPMTTGRNFDEVLRGSTRCSSPLSTRWQRRLTGSRARMLSSRARSATTTPARPTRKAGTHRGPISASCRSRGTEKHGAKRNVERGFAGFAIWMTAARGRRDLRAAGSEQPADEEAGTMTNAIFESVSAPRADHLQLASPAAAADTGVSPDVTGFYDEATGSIQYVVADPLTRKSAIIDPVLDFDPRSGSTRTTSADRLLKHIEIQGITLEWILDTHPHTDHFSAAGYLKDITGASTGIGERVVEMQRLWKAIYNLPDSVPVDGSQWDRLFADGERFTVGEMEVSVLLSPGHTLSSVTYLMGNAAFVHDTLFMPDSGTARADLPGGDARQLWRTTQRILQLPSDTRLFPGHDYRPNGRKASWESTVALQRAHNLHLKNCDESKFVKLRTERDRSLPMPALMLSALQVNLAGGRLPPPESDGRRYLKIPLNAFPQASWGSLGPDKNIVG